MLKISTLLAFLISLQPFSFASAATNFWGDYGRGVFRAGQNGDVVPNRSYFKTSVEEAPGGFKLIVDIVSGEFNVPVSLDLQVAINTGETAQESIIAIPIAHLSDPVADNPTSYSSRREYLLTYDQLNTELAKVLPPAAQGLKIGPGTALFLFAQWPQWGHVWGGLGRGGIFFTPKSTTNDSVRSRTNRHPEELDVAYPISAPMTIKYNKIQGPNSLSSGLKLDGQIRSRLEKEGKFQVPLSKVAIVKKKLYALANNPSLAAKVLGPDWTIEAQLRYMKKDANGNLILDAQGLPIPDPMIDTYYDNAHMDAAKNDVAIRYRWTEQNGTGAWNIKPGRGLVSKDGSVNRIEYGVDTTDDRPETVMRFADSEDPLNPFRSIRQIIPGAVPSDFLKPALKIVDTRYKFKLKHKNGLVIEISLDDVQASSLRRSAQGRYVQLEMDVDHLSTASANVAQVTGAFDYLALTLTEDKKVSLAALTEKAFIDGTPVIHNISDLIPTSPVMKNHQADFDLAEKAIISLRQETLGDRWLPAPQKASLAAYMLELVKPKEAAASVKDLMRRAQKFSAMGAEPGMLMQRFAPAKVRCDLLF
jgi:hypothetical protein